MNNSLVFIRRVFAAFVTKGLGATLLLLSNVFVARNFEIDESAVFFIVLNILIGATICINMGLNTTLMRMISSASFLPEFVAAAFFEGVKRLMLLSFLFIITVAFFSNNLELFFNKSGLSHSLLMAIPAIFFGSLSLFFSSCIQGLNKPISSIITLNIVPSASILCASFFSLVDDAAGLSLVLSIGYLFSFLYGLHSCKSIFEKGFRNGCFLKKSFVGSGSFWLIDVVLQLNLAGIIIITSQYLDYIEVSQLNSALRLSLVISFILPAVNLICAPRFSELHYRSNKSELLDLVRYSTLLMILFALPIVLVMFYYSNFFMSFFGGDFSDAGNILRVLIIGQFLNVCVGSVGYLLNMSGHEKIMRNITVLVNIPVFVVTIKLTILFGVMGAAIGITLGLSLQNIVALIYVRKCLGFYTFPVKLSEIRLLP
jgi:O-antigen/teichoic acid export membrane protein